MSDRARYVTLVYVLTRVLFVLIIFGPGLVYTGVAEPYISPPPFIFGEIDVLGIVFGGVLLVVVAKPTARLRARYWRATATEAGLTPADDESASTHEYTGTVDGRRVRATIGADPALSTESRKTRYTLVEAALGETHTVGVVLGPADQEAYMTPYDVAAFADVERDGVVAASNRDGLAAAVCTSAVVDGLVAVDGLNQVYAGDAKAVGDTFPADERTPFGTNPGVTRQIEAAHDDEMDGTDWLGGRDWVSHVTRGTVLDADELRRQIEAVVLVARAFEEAT